MYQKVGQNLLESEAGNLLQSWLIVIGTKWNNLITKWGRSHKVE